MPVRVKSRRSPSSAPCTRCCLRARTIGSPTTTPRYEAIASCRQPAQDRSCFRLPASTSRQSSISSRPGWCRRFSSGGPRMRLALATIARTRPETGALARGRPQCRPAASPCEHGCSLGRERFGDPTSPVQLVTSLRSSQPPPDLDAIPSLASSTVIDLNPLDPSNDADRAGSRRWSGRRTATRRHCCMRRWRSPILSRSSSLSGDELDAESGMASSLVPAGDARRIHSTTRMHGPASTHSVCPRRR